MRSWGRTTDEFGNKTWVQVNPDPNTGLLDMIYVTTLVQVMQLSINESPFYADWGIAAQQSVESQVYPDYYIARIQQRFAQYFASLIISRAPVPIPLPRNYRPTPTYNAQVLTHQGIRLSLSVPIPV